MNENSTAEVEKKNNKFKIYFDLSSAIKHLRSDIDGTITGIQRVEINIAWQMRKYGSNIYISFFDIESNQHLCFPAALLEEEVSLSKELVFSKIGIYRSGFFPHKENLKKVLNLSKKKRLSRFFFKAYLYAIAIFNRPLYYKYFPKSIAPVANLEEITCLSENDIFFIVGSTITTPELISPCQKLKEKGGVIVQVIHDLIPITKKEFFPEISSAIFLEWTKNLKNYVTHICCVSKYTQKEVLRVLGPEGFSSVDSISLAHEFSGFPRSIALHHLTKTNSPYVLCVGTLEIRKNGANLLRAWRKVIINLEKKTPKLVFAGKIGWLLEDFYRELESDQHLKSFVSIIEEPSDEDLVELYLNSLFTIFPSLHEGWGLPIGESLWFGKACITSNVSSMPEVGGNLVNYIDPDNVDQIASEVIKLIVDEDKLNLQEINIKNAPLRSWSDVGKDIYSYITEISAHNKNKI